MCPEITSGGLLSVITVKMLERARMTASWKSLISRDGVSGDGWRSACGRSLVAFVAASANDKWGMNVSCGKNSPMRAILSFIVFRM